MVTPLLLLLLLLFLLLLLHIHTSKFKPLLFCLHFADWVPQWVLGGRGVLVFCHRSSSSQGVKLTTHPSSAKVMNEWSYTSTPYVCLHGVDSLISSVLFWVIAQCMGTTIMFHNIPEEVRSYLLHGGNLKS